MNTHERLVRLQVAIIIGMAIVLLVVPIVVVTAHTVPIRVYLLAGQSNMVGMGSMEHLDLLVHKNNSTAGCNPYRRDLWNGTQYKVRKIE